MGRSVGPKRKKKESDRKKKNKTKKKERVWLNKKALFGLVALLVSLKGQSRSVPAKAIHVAVQISSVNKAV